jgi:CMP-N-acetylneuraminic acid synthetase
MTERNVIVIPARGGSQGIKEKNIQLVGGFPLVVRSLKHAREMGSEFTKILSTDSQRVMDAVTNFLGIKSFELSEHPTDSLHDLGPIMVHFRGEEFADSKALIGTALKHLRLLCLEQSKRFDCWVLLQPTSPFRSRIEIQNLSAQINTHFKENDSWVSVKKIDDSHPARMYEMCADNRMRSIPGYQHLKSTRRQDLPALYLRDGAFYCICDKLVAEGRQFSDSPMPLLRNGPWTINIDNQMDLDLARLYSEILSE